MSGLQIDDLLVQRIAHTVAGLEAVPEAVPAIESPRAPATGACAEHLLREQPEVLAFLLAGTAQLVGETRAVAVFLGEVVFEAFRAAGRSTRPVSPSGLVAALRQNREMAVRVGQAHDRIAERYLRNSNTLRQPALIRYVTGVLLEPDATCPHAIPRDELGPLFIVLKSVIDVLDEDAGGRAASPASEPA